MTDYQPVPIIDLSISHKNNELHSVNLCLFIGVFLWVLIIREGFINVVGQVIPTASFFDHAKVTLLHSSGEE